MILRTSRPFTSALSGALVALTLIISALAAAPAPAAAQSSGERCFPETGHCISGAIRQYWERNGGLAVFGYPITPLRREVIEGSWVGPVQWFERDRLEDHANEGKGVLAGRLGARYLELQGINWQTLPAPDVAVPGCRLFPETRQYVCGAFLRYWEQNGGLERFGYPLTGLRQETIQGREYAVQYFERRRMELHPENAGTPYEVLLGLLGRAVYAVEGDSNVRPVAADDVAADIQQPILDAAYASLRGATRARLAVGLVDVAGDRATVLAEPFGEFARTIDLVRRNGAWTVVPARETPGGSRAAIITLALDQLQDPRGSGLNVYITRPRIAGDFARAWFVPAPSENRDPVTAFFKRENNTWRFLTAGSAFPEDDLRAMGVPQELWPYGEVVRGPNG